MPCSSGPPAVGLLAEFQVNKRLGRRDARDGSNAAENLEEVIVVLAHHLDQDVERAGREDDVVDFLHTREMSGNPLQVAAAADTDHGLAREAERHWIGHSDDLHGASIDEPLDALPHGCLGKPNGLSDRRVGAPAILLELLDYLLRQVIKDDPATSLARRRCTAAAGSRGYWSHRRMRHPSASLR